jgi:hypothetical protein
MLRYYSILLNFSCNILTVINMESSHALLKWY